MCEIDQGMGIHSLVATSAFVFELLRDKEEAVFGPNVALLRKFN